jgi:long-chain acyl-CoA synthetase
VLALDEHLRGAVVLGWPPGPDLRVHAVLVLDDVSLAEAVVRDANARLGAHQQIRGLTIWPDEDLPRTLTLKVRKHEVLERLATLEAPTRAGRVRAVGAATADDAAATTGAGRQPGEPRPDRRTAIVASLADVDASSVGPGTRLSSDLDLDSLQRVELLGVIEEEMGTYVDDDALAPDATLAELGALVRAAEGAPRRTGDWRWPLHPAVRAIGLGVQVLVMAPLVRLCYRVTVSGLEHLDGHDGPVLMTPNHCLHADDFVLLKTLPLRVRWKLSIAAAADTIHANPVQGLLASVLGNTFPLQREGGVRRSLEMLGLRLDRGFSILLYPEGKLTVGGPMQPFKPGIGLIAVEGGTPVVPVKLDIRRMARYDRRRLPAPLRGEVHVSVGAPIRFESGTDPVAATSHLEQVLAAM